MAARLGNVIYWLACAVAVLMLAVVPIALLIEARDEAWWIDTAIHVIAPAILIWLAGRGVKYVLAGR